MTTQPEAQRKMPRLIRSLPTPVVQDEIKSLLCPKCGSMSNLVHELVDHGGWNEVDARASFPHFLCRDCDHDCPTSEVGK